MRRGTLQLPTLALAGALTLGALVGGGCSRDPDPSASPTTGPGTTARVDASGSTPAAPSTGTASGTAPGTGPDGRDAGGSAAGGGGSGGNSGSSGQGGASGNSSPGAAEDGLHPERCTPASAALLADIGTGLRTEGARLVAGAVVEVRAPGPDAPGIYLVGARAEGPDVDAATTGVWVTSDPSGEGGLAFAVDDAAQSLTDWRPASSADPPITPDSDGVADARACARG